MQQIERIKKAVKEAKKYVRQSLSNILWFSKRGMLLHIHYDIFIEHYEAIIILLENKKIESALALLRTLLDTEYRGLWLYFIAQDEQIEDYLNTHNYGFSRNMWKQLDKRLTNGNYFYKTKRKAWNYLSSYSHTDKNPIWKRWNSKKGSDPYSEDNYLLVLEIAESALLEFTYLLLIAFEKKEAIHYRILLQERIPIKEDKPTNGEIFLDKHDIIQDVRFPLDIRMDFFDNHILKVHIPYDSFGDFDIKDNSTRRNTYMLK